MAADGRVVLRDVTVRYGRRVALEGISGEFVSGSLTAVVGANGAGKSTLLAAIAGVVRLAGGLVTCAARPRLAYLPQLAAIDREYPLTVFELDHARRVAGFRRIPLSRNGSQGARRDGG